MKAGIAGTDAPYVLISMADGSDEPHVVDSMVELARSGADVVAASRYMRGGGQVGGPLLKRLMSRAAGLTLHWFAGVRTHDPTNNFKLYSRRFLDAVTIESSAGFELALELTVKATLDGRPVAEVPTTWRDRTAGQSNFKLRKWLPPLPPLVPRCGHGSVAAAGRATPGIASAPRGAVTRARKQASVTASIATDPAIPSGPWTGSRSPICGDGGTAARGFQRERDAEDDPRYEEPPFSG